MSNLQTYDDLVSDVQAWLFGRTDIAPAIPTFIRLFEAKANRVLLCRQMEVRVTATVDMTDPSPEFIQLPGDFQTMRRIRLINNFVTTGVSTQKPRLKYASGAQMDELRAENPQAGPPVWFSIQGDEIELCPTPDQAYQIEMVYRQNVAPLSASNQANWLLSLAPDAYLYGALMEAAPYLHEDERVSVWANGLQSAFSQLNQLSEESTYSAGPLTTRRTGRKYS